MQALQVAALALPVADGEIDEVELRDIAKVGDGKDRGEDGLKAVVFALGGQLIHLQKALVGAALHFDQVRNLDCRLGSWKSRDGYEGRGSRSACFTPHDPWTRGSGRRPEERFRPGRAEILVIAVALGSAAPRLDRVKTSRLFAYCISSKRVSAILRLKNARLLRTCRAANNPVDAWTFDGRAGFLRSEGQKSR